MAKQLLRAVVTSVAAIVALVSFVLIASEIVEGAKCLDRERGLPTANAQE